MVVYLILQLGINSKSISDLFFIKAEFWVQVHNIPKDIMNDENARKLGKIIKVNLSFVENKIVRTFLKIRVLVDLSIPQVKSGWIKREMGKT